MPLATPLCPSYSKLQEEISRLQERLRVMEDLSTKQAEIILEQGKLITEQAKQIQTLTDRNNYLEEQLFGSKSERLCKIKKDKAANDNNPNNGSNSGETKKSCKKLARTAPDRSNYRKKAPPHLPRIELTTKLPADEMNCEYCGEPLSVIGKKITEQLDVISQLLQVIQTIREQYGCKKCKHPKSMKVAPFPNKHYKNSMFTPKALAWIINYKYNYHVPIYRTARIFAEHSHKISDKSINSAVLKVSMLLLSLYELGKNILVRSNHLFSDDTTCRLVVEGSHKTKIARLWVYISKADPNLVIYEFTRTREGKHPQKFLKDFKGYLQTDAYAAYKALYKDENDNDVVIPVYCIGHSRRKFYEIARYTKHIGVADQALEYFGKLYAIEEDAKKLSTEERYNIRQNKSIPILDEFFSWLNTEQKTIMPETKLADAIYYATNNESELRNYCLDGRLEIDNLRAEHAMRGPTVGENNYLFFGGESGGKAAAIFYSFVESCKANDISFFAWLTDVIEKLQYYKITEIEELLPHNWKHKFHTPKEESTTENLAA